MDIHTLQQHGTWLSGPQELVKDGELQEGGSKVPCRLWKDWGAFHREGAREEMLVSADSDAVSIGCDMVETLKRRFLELRVGGQEFIAAPSSCKTSAIYQGNSPSEVLCW